MYFVVIVVFVFYLWYVMCVKGEGELRREVVFVGEFWVNSKVIVKFFRFVEVY